MATTESSLMKEYSSATGGWRSYLTYTTSTTDTAVTITCVGGVRSDYWSFAITSGITSTLSCTGQSSVSGSGGLSSNWSSDVYNQLVSKTYTIQRTSSAKTVTISCSTTNASGYINGTATASATVTIPALAVTNYTVSYNENGGVFAPPDGTKSSSATYYITTITPYRNGYKFLGWATSASSSTVAYKVGSAYTANANITLYAVWEKLPSHTLYVNDAGASSVNGVYIKIPDGSSASDVYYKS